MKSWKENMDSIRNSKDKSKTLESSQDPLQTIAERVREMNAKSSNVKVVMSDLHDLTTYKLSDMSDEELEEFEGNLQKELSTVSHYLKQRIHGRSRYHGQNF